MTWHPTPQVPCDCEECAGQSDIPAPRPTFIEGTPLRECGVTGCGYCDPVRQWIEDTDPDPAPSSGGGDRLPTRKATT